MYETEVFILRVSDLALREGAVSVFQDNIAWIIWFFFHSLVQLCFWGQISSVPYQIFQNQYLSFCVHYRYWLVVNLFLSISQTFSMILVLVMCQLLIGVPEVTLQYHRNGANSWYTSPYKYSIRNAASEFIFIVFVGKLVCFYFFYIISNVQNFVTYWLNLGTHLLR